MVKIVFLRHATPKIKTYDVNAGARFIGRSLNPPINILSKKNLETIKKKTQSCGLFVSSPLKRCIETMELITKGSIQIDKRLTEIEYGALDGMYVKEAKVKFPLLFLTWEEGVDARFPGGENHLDVIRRVKRFIRDINGVHQDVLVCTHNVVLRCIIGSTLRLPVEQWHNIIIPYAEPLLFELCEGKLTYKGSQRQQKRLLKNVDSPKEKEYFVALCPEKKIRKKIKKTKRFIEKRWGNQKYLSDPPHVTLYLAVTKNREEIKTHVKNIAKKTKKIKSTISKNYQSFEKDPFEEGRTTVYLDFDDKTNKQIHHLQEKLVEALNPLRANRVSQRYASKKIRGDLRESLQQYGFPFVKNKKGKNILLPHLSFCAFKNIALANQFKREVSPKKFSGKTSLDCLEVYEIKDGQIPSLIASYKLQ